MSLFMKCGFIKLLIIIYLFMNRRVVYEVFLYEVFAYEVVCL